MPGVGVSFPRAPLSRTAVLAGPANDFQRNGMGEMPGPDRPDRPDRRRRGGALGRRSGIGRGRFPLLAEVLAGCALAYLIGLGIGWLLFGRKKRESYL